MVFELGIVHCTDVGRTAGSSVSAQESVCLTASWGAANGSMHPAQDVDAPFSRRSRRIERKTCVVLRLGAP